MIFFNLHYIREISKVVLKKKTLVMQYARETLCNPVCLAYRLLYCTHFIQHKLVIYAHVYDIVFLQTTLLISCIVRVKIIKILSSRWWRFELATCAIALLLRLKKVGYRIV